MKYGTLLLVLLSPCLLAQQTAINELDFPYTPGYEFTLEGKSSFFDPQTGKLLGQQPDKMHYAVSKGKVNASGLKCNFDVQYFNPKGEITLAVDSWLIINSSGMQWGHKGKPKMKHPTQAVVLPLTQTTRWNTWSNNEPAVLECHTLDTVIHTYLGPVHAFGVRSSFTVAEEKYDQYFVVDEFYTQYWGKISTHVTVYMQMKGSSERKRVMESTDWISASTLPKERQEKIRWADEN